MDPNALLARFLDALADGNRAEVTESLNALHNWIATGGFLPVDPREGLISAQHAADLFYGGPSADDADDQL